jgi:hypothetical protein
LLGAGFRRLVPLILRQLFVLLCPVLGRSRALLGCSLLPQVRVARNVTSSLLAATEQLVQKSHASPSSVVRIVPADLPAPKVQKTPEPTNPEVHRL